MFSEKAYRDPHEAAGAPRTSDCRRLSRRSGTSDTSSGREQAIAARLARIEALLQPTEETPPSPIEFGQLLDRHLASVANPNTHRDKVSRYKRPRRLWAGRLAHEIERRDVHHLREQILGEEGLDGASWNRTASYLSAAFRDGLARGNVLENPIAGVKRAKETRRTMPWIDIEAQERLLDAIPVERIRVAAAVMLHCGIRWSEFVRLRVSDYRPGEDAELVVRKSKNHRGRRIPVSRAGAKALDWLAEDAKRAGRTHLSAHRTYSYMRKVFVRGKVDAGMEDTLPAAFHSLRHFYAANALRAGIPASDIARLIGTSLAMVTTRYADHSPSGFREMARAKMDAFQGAG